MVTKSIRLTEEEAAELQKYLAVTGEVEAAVLKRGTLRGLKELRLEQGILAYLTGQGSAEAADIAGLPRGIPARSHRPGDHPPYRAFDAGDGARGARGAAGRSATRRCCA